MHGFVRVLQTVTHVVPAVAFIEIAAGGPEMQFAIADSGCIFLHVLLLFPRQPLPARGFIHVQRRQPRIEILAGDQVAAP